MEEEKWDAIARCDAQYDGVFYYGVMSTGIYCRPSCRSRTPLRRNVRVFATAEEAKEAGLRACKRCRPEELAWRGTQEELVAGAWQVVEAGYREALTLQEVAERLHVSPFHLHRTFRNRQGITLAQAILQKRMGAAQQLLLKGELTVTEIAYAVGYQSAAHFASAFKKECGLTPSEYRQKRTSTEL